MSASVSDREHERIRATVAAIPPDATTGLEIGFHDLRVTRELAPRLRLVSVDLPGPPPPESTYRLAHATIEALPFRDRAFDVVVCTEVLEHLEASVLASAMRELARVSRKYVLVSVPYRQRVWNERFKCRECGYVGHTMGHVRCLDEASLAALLPSARVLRSWLLGRHTGYAPDWLYRLANRAGGVWNDYAGSGACPSCGRTAEAVRPNLLGWLLQRVLWRVERLVPERAAWVVMLFSIV